LDKVTSDPHSSFAGAPVNFSNLRVLVVDDDATLFTEMRAMLREIGFNDIHGCTSTNHALIDMRKKTPDLIIMEIQMNGASGINLLRRIRAGAAKVVDNVPIVLTSNKVGVTLAFKACEPGIENYIRKPIDADDFRQRILSTVENPIRIIGVKSYFGPDRRKNNGGNYIGEEHRAPLKEKKVRIAPPPRKVERPEHFASPPRKTNSGPVIEAKKADAPPTKPEKGTVELTGQVQADPVPKVKVENAPEAKKAAVPEQKSTNPKPQTKTVYATTTLKRPPVIN